MAVWLLPGPGGQGGGRGAGTRFAHGDPRQVDRPGSCSRLALADTLDPTSKRTPGRAQGPALDLEPGGRLRMQENYRDVPGE